MGMIGQIKLRNGKIKRLSKVLMSNCGASRGLKMKSAVSGAKTKSAGKRSSKKNKFCKKDEPKRKNRKRRRRKKHKQDWRETKDLQN